MKVAILNLASRHQSVEYPDPYYSYVYQVLGGNGNLTISLAGSYHLCLHNTTGVRNWLPQNLARRPKQTAHADIGSLC